MIVVLIALLFIFQNIHSLFSEYETIGIHNPSQLLENTRELKKIFTGLSIVTGLILLATGFYLVVLFKREREEPEYKDIPPLQDYLLQLRSSESQLKDMVATQKETVAQKEELNKNIVNNIDAAIIFLNPGGRIEIFNAAAETMFSQSYANAINNLPENVLSRFPGIISFVREHEGQRISREITSGEKTHWVHLNPMEQVGLLIIARDVTEEKKREEIDRRNSNFVMLGEMTAFLAHEVRNSLGVIFGYTKTIKAEKEKIEKINKEILFLTDMMESFLNFSRPVTINKEEEIDLVTMLQKIAAEKEIAVDVPAEPVFIKNDAVLVQSIFSNLVLNSKEAGADKIKVTFKKGKNLEISLNDNGKGIDPKIRGKIWYPFFTTRDKGTGMGLPSIRKVINTLKGEIALKESGSDGTTFKIVFYS